MEEVLIPFPSPDKTPPVTMTYFTSNHGIAPSGGCLIKFGSQKRRTNRSQCAPRPSRALRGAKAYNGRTDGLARGCRGAREIRRTPDWIAGSGLLAPGRRWDDVFARIRSRQAGPCCCILVQSLPVRASVGRSDDCRSAGGRGERRPVRDDQRERWGELS